MSLRHCLIIAAIVYPTTLSSSTPATDAAANPVIIARFQPIDKLFDDAKFLAGKFGKPEAAKGLEEKLLQLLGIENLAGSGIDTKKPIGAYVVVDADWTESTEVLLLPVKDDKALLAFAGKFQVKADKIDDNFYSLSFPDWPLPMFLRFTGGYAYITAFQKEALDPEKLISPSRVFTVNEPAALVVNVRPEFIPESARKSAIDALVEHIKEWADDDDTATGKAVIRWCQSWGEKFGQDGREAIIRVNFDRPSGELTFDFSVAPKPGSPFAYEISAFKPSQSLFTKLVGPQGAINELVNIRLPDELSKHLATVLQDPGVDLFDAFGLGDIEDEKAKEEIRKVFRAIAPSFEEGLVDVAVTLHGPVSKLYCGVYGIRLKNGKKIEEQIKKAVAALPEDKRDRVKFDVEKASGFAIHSIQLESSEFPIEKIFGPGLMHIGFRDDAMVAAFGENAAKAVGESLSSLSPQPAPALQFDVTCGKLKPFCDAFDETIYGYVRSILGTDDRLRVYAGNIEGGNALKASVTVSLQAIVGVIINLGGISG
jgi:hypothetical protein